MLCGKGSGTDEIEPFARPHSQSHAAFAAKDAGAGADGMFRRQTDPQDVSVHDRIAAAVRPRRRRSRD
ncbi:MAG: hypothetical protein ACLSGI_06835 [Butyricicoccaceae bacterium]